VNASERKALELLQERAGSSPWTTTHADAALACGLPERTWRRVVGSLAESGLVSVYRGKHAVLFAVEKGHSSESRTAKNGHERPRTAMNGQSRTTMNGHSPRAVSSVVVDDVSKEETTTSTTTTVVEQTTRDENGHERPLFNGQERPIENGQQRPLGPNARAELLELYRIALDLAEELGSVKAERDALRAAHRDPKPENLVAPTEAPCRDPALTSAARAATPVAATGPMPAGVPAAPAQAPIESASASPPTRPERSAPPSSSPPPLHPANSRAEIVLGPEAEDPDREEDVRAFRALIAAPHASEQDVEAQLLRALGYPGRLHLAVASVEIAKAEGGNLEFPARFAWSVISGKTLPSPGSSKSWAELRSTVLPALRAEAARKAAGKTARGDSGGAHRVEHVSRPIQLNPVQQRQQEVRARQAARYLEDAKRALARQTAGGSP